MIPDSPASPSDHRLLGKIVRLQIQPQSLKIEVDGHKRYDPAGLVSVDALTLTATGARATLPNGTVQLDVHNTEHPQTKIWGPNFLSFGFTAHYDAMTAEYGPHVTLGCAGENIIIATDTVIALESVSGGVWIETRDGPVALSGVVVANPCKPFADFALQSSEAPIPDVKAALQFLADGRRGYYAQLRSVDVATVRVGDAVFTRHSA